MPHRPTLRRLARTALAVTLAVAATTVAAPPATASVATPRIVGGTTLTSNVSAPYTAAIEVRFSPQAVSGCSGTVIGPQHVLTAAHCVIRDGVTAAPEGIRVGVGHHEIVSDQGRAATTVVGVAAVRVHPLYAASVYSDDVAVLSLATPLDFSTGRIAPLALAPIGTQVPSDTPIRVTGFGASASFANDFGTLRSVRTRSRIASLCGTDASAVMLCTFRPGHAACEGDSGGTATIDGGRLLIGVTNTAAKSCSAGLNLFANVAAPEIRTFIDAAVTETTLTADQISVAPRGGTRVRISGSVRRGRTVTCLRGRWTGTGNRYRYSFLRITGPRAHSTTLSRKRTYRVRARDRGSRIGCAVEATNPGGSGVALGRTLRGVR